MGVGYDLLEATFKEEQAAHQRACHYIHALAHGGTFADCGEPFCDYWTRDSKARLEQAGGLRPGNGRSRPALRSEDLGQSGRSS